MIAEPISAKAIKDIALFVRESLYDFIDKNGKLDIVRAIEYKCQDLGFEYEIVEETDMPDAYATTDVKRKRLYVREDVYDEAAEGNGRHRFTLAHELGHILLHQEVRMANKDENCKIYCHPEWQANEFASWLLCPVKSPNATKSRTALRYGVSEQVAQIQIDKIKK